MVLLSGTVDCERCLLLDREREVYKEEDDTGISLRSIWVRTWLEWSWNGGHAELGMN